jgi:cyclophilin family peptidyl-prolyl cis-trans isomerase
MKKFPTLLIVTACVIVTGLASYSSMLPKRAVPGSNASQAPQASLKEGPVSQVTITAGPFDIHRKYRSMEGPYTNFSGTIADMVASKNIILPESRVNFVEGNSSAAPSMKVSTDSDNGNVQGLVDASQSDRMLYWLKGIKLEVLDENDHVLPTAEFICHYNLDVDPEFRNKVFPEGERCVSSRIVTITQGQTEVSFPEGFGVPVASDERWSMVFQAANRTTTEHKRVKHRCTMYFLKDSALVYPIKPLHWFAPYIRVVLDKDSPEIRQAEKQNCPSCFGLSMGVNAPNNTKDGIFTDPAGRRVSGHWVIPPGIHTYRSIVDESLDPGFSARDRVIHAVWSHLHPLCTNFSLYKCSGDSRQVVFSNNETTKTSPGLEIQHIDYLSSKEGIPMPSKAKYELEVTYNNTTGEPQDSMSVAGIFFADTTFARPEWVFKSEPMAVNCMVDNKCHSKEKPAMASAPSPSSSGSELPLFNKSTDGPLVSGKKLVEVKTNAGPITIELDGTSAPVTSTQMYRLFTSHAFDGTTICNYSPYYLIQFALAEDKAQGQPALPDELKKELRRLPVEIPLETAGGLRHKKGAITLARQAQDREGGSSSFSIMLADAPHLDSDYTCFGKVVENASTKKTLKNIVDHWSSGKFWIVSSKAL